jgi:hypothetical protein
MKQMCIYREILGIKSLEIGGFGVAYMRKYHAFVYLLEPSHLVRHVFIKWSAVSVKQTRTFQNKPFHAGFIDLCTLNVNILTERDMV